MEINRKLVKTNSGGSDPELAESLQTLAICRKDSGQAQDAIAAIEESVEIFNRLYDKYPESFRPLLAAAINVLRDCFLGIGRMEEADEMREKAGRLRI